MPGLVAVYFRSVLGLTDSDFVALHIVQPEQDTSILIFVWHLLWDDARGRVGIVSVP